jgi:fermentation-respiration switch protein FrsA (DUF1100 family)
MGIATADVPVVLIAPAWRFWGTATLASPATVVIHSEADEVIPIAHSRALLAASALPDTALVIAGCDHNMVDDEAFAALDRVLSARDPRARDDPGVRFD